MNPRLRSALLLLATLFIGMVLGALIRSSVSDHRMRRGTMRTDDGFIASYERTIQPRDDKQAAEIRVVLSETAPEVITLIQTNQAAVREHIDAMRERLEPLLDEEQKARLEKRFNRRRHRATEGR